jgi:hypothetical protein
VFPGTLKNVIGVDYITAIWKVSMLRGCFSAANLAARTPRRAKTARHTFALIFWAADGLISYQRERDVMAKRILHTLPAPLAVLVGTLRFGANSVDGGCIGKPDKEIMDGAETRGKSLPA